MGKHDDAERVEVRSRADWRRWLEAHHDASDGIWLVRWRKHTEHHLPWSDVVEEALCFGWIDGLTRKLDADRTMLWLCPRRPGSNWSGINKRTVASLETRGLMTSAGTEAVERAKADGSWSALDDVEAMVVPDDLGAALDGDGDARVAWDALPPSRKKGFLWWVTSAKRDRTRRDRIAKAVATLASGGQGPGLTSAPGCAGRTPSRRGAGPAPA